MRDHTAQLCICIMLWNTGDGKLHESIAFGGKNGRMIDCCENRIVLQTRNELTWIEAYGPNCLRCQPYQ